MEKMDASAGYQPSPGGYPGYSQPMDAQMQGGGGYPMMQSPPPVGVQYQPQLQAQPPQQQQQQQQHTVIIQQPVTATVIPQNVRDWSYGLCGCCEDCGECCFMYFCPMCYWCSLSSRMGENFCGPFCCGDLFRVGMRAKIRTMYGIRGSLCDDTCCVLCCPCCVGIQMSRELKAHGMVMAM